MMTVGVGGSTAEAELAAIKNMRGDVPPIGVAERLRRIAHPGRTLLPSLWYASRHGGPIPRRGAG